MVASTVHAEIKRLGYSPTEFATAFGCSRQHVQNLIARGELPSIKLGRKRIIPARAVEELLEGGPDAA
jgi:excisionase family DNA binding protein